jgi:hypothetical protein
MLLIMTSTKKAVSPHRITAVENETLTEALSRDLVAINEFLHFVNAEPFIAPEKGENRRRVANPLLTKQIEANLLATL